MYIVDRGVSICMRSSDTSSEWYQKYFGYERVAQNLEPRFRGEQKKRNDLDVIVEFEKNRMLQAHIYEDSPGQFLSKLVKK